MSFRVTCRKERARGNDLRLLQYGSDTWHDGTVTINHINDGVESSQQAMHYHLFIDPKDIPAIIP